jgi:hypothetical protein
MELFEFINVMFTKPAEFKKLSLHERGKHFFMINRFMSIKFPIQAYYINHTKIHPGQAVTFWQEFLQGKFTKVPTWMYTKLNKKKAEKAMGVDVSEEILNLYCQKNQCSRKVLQEAIQLIGEPMIKELKDLENLIVKNS